MTKRAAKYWWSTILQAVGGNPVASNVAITNPSIGVEATGSYDYAFAVAQALAPPVVDRIQLSGTFISGQTITATLNGITGDVAVGTCIWRIYRSNDIQQGGETLVTTISATLGTSINYVLVIADETKYIRVECDVRGANGEVGETLSSEYSSAVAAAAPAFGNVVWQNIQNTTPTGNTVEHTTAGSAGIAKSVQVLPGDGEITYDWNAATRDDTSDLIIGLILQSDSVTRANVPLFFVIRAGNFNIDHFENGTYKATTSFRQADGGTYTTMRYKIKRVGGVLTCETSANGGAYVVNYTRVGGVVNGAAQMVFLDNLTTAGKKCVNATINTIP